MMIRIFLIGYMGAGKTTLGKAFAKKYNLSFVDLDWYIEERFHKTVQELFAERGEDGFRELERNMLHEVADFENVIISTGGGIILNKENIEYLSQESLKIENNLKKCFTSVGILGIIDRQSGRRAETEH